MQKITKLIAFACVFSLFSCSFLKLDPNSNCLNDKAACHKSDATRPTFVQTVLPAPGIVVSTLGEVQLLFSEELNNPQPSDFTYSEPGLTVQSVSKIDKFTYRLLNNRNPNQGGPLTLSFTGLKDYNGNSITNGSITYTINLNIPVTTSATHAGVSTGGYPTVSVSWHYSYTPVIAGDTVYHVRLTTGAEDCSAGSAITPATATPLVNSVVQTYDETNSTTIAATTYTFSVNTSVITSLGAQKILICLTNVNNNKYGTGVINVVRDDSDPTIVISPPSGNYITPQTLTFTCTDNADKVIYNLASNVGLGVDPVAADVAEPTFNPATGEVTNGEVYNSSNKPETPYTSNTTRTIYKYRCIDKAGNIYPEHATPALVSGVYRINSSFPTVTYMSLTKTGATPAVDITAVGAGGYTSATLEWRTNQVGQDWEIRSGGSDCGVGGTVVASGSGVTATPSPANTPIQTTILHTSPGIALGLNRLRVCVTNGTDWGQIGLNLLRDDTAPAALTVNVPPADYGATQNLVFTCTDNEDRITFTESFSAPTATPDDPGDPQFDADGRRTVGTLHTGPHAVTTDPTSLIGRKTRIKYRCIDKAGHVTAVNDITYTIDSLLPTVTVQNQTQTAVSTQPGAHNSVQITWLANRQISGYDIRRGSTNCTDGTVLSVGTNLSSGSVLAAGTVVTSTIMADNLNFPTLGSHTLHICTTNSIGAKGYTTRTIFYDNTPPTFGGLTAFVTAAGTGNFTLGWTLADDGAGSGVAIYNIYRETTSGGAYPTVHHTAAHPTNQITVSVPVATDTYYYIAEAVDNAGNRTKVTLAEFGTKPSIRLVVAGLDTANSKQFTFTDGITSNTIAANSAAPGVIWASTIATGQTYNLAVTVQPTGQVCTVRQLQHGTLTGDGTVNIDCTNGYLTAGRFQVPPVQPTRISLYRGALTTRASVQTDPNSPVVQGGFIHYGNYLDCDGATAGNQYCIYRVGVDSGGANIYVTGLSGVVRAIVGDGNNLYFATMSPGNRLYKLPSGSTTPIELASGFNEIFALAIDGNNLFIAEKEASAIRNYNLASGTLTTVASGLANKPLGLTIVGANLYYTGENSNGISRIAKTGGAITMPYGQVLPAGHQDNNGTAARFSQPHDLVYDGVENIYVTEYTGHRIRRINLLTDRVTTIAGDGTGSTYIGSTGISAKIPAPVGITSDGRSLFFSAHSVADNIVRVGEANLTSHWPLTGNTLGYANGVAITNYNLSATGAFTYPPGRFNEANGAHRFDGSNYLEVADQPQFDLAGFYTISVWINRNAAGVMRIIDKITPGSCDGYTLDITSDNKLRLLYCHVNAAGQDVLSGSPVPVGQWVHVAATFSAWNRRARLYINGALNAEKTTGAGTTLSNGLSLRIGADHTTVPGPQSHFSGAMADVRLYSRELSEGEINELAQDASSAQVGASYNTGATELLAHYTFTNGTPSTAAVAASGPVGENLTGSASSPTGKDGDASGSAYFAGSASLALNAAGLPLGNAPRTVCAYYRPASLPTNAIRYIFSYGTGGSNEQFGIGTANESGVSYLDNIFNSPAINQDHVFSYTSHINTWQQLCAVYDGAVSILYYNGRQVSTHTRAIDTKAGNARVGAIYNDGQYFAGDLDDIRVYNKALSALQIRQLAVQVPAGLVARYDFLSDHIDTSGSGQNLANNNGASFTSDRFGFSNSAVTFTPPAHLSGTATRLPLGNSPRTMCAWSNPTNLLNGQFSEVAMYGTAAAGWGIGMDAAGGLPNGRIFLLNGVFDLIYAQPHGLNRWRHVCARFDGSTESLFLDGALVASAGRTVNTAAGSIVVGLGVFGGGDYFNGAIDDVVIYDRALTTSEIQILQRQPNKRLQLSGPTVQGDMGGSPSGIVGADQRCPAGFKAMIVDGVNRRACTTANCGAGLVENIDWVLRPNITYVNSPAGLPIFTADFNSVWNFSGTAPTGGNLQNEIYNSSQAAWTGLTGDWLVAFSGGDLDCSDWASIGGNGAFGRTNGLGANSIFQSTSACSDTSNYLYCVEQ